MEISKVYRFEEVESIIEIRQAEGDQRPTVYIEESSSNVNRVAIAEKDVNGRDTLIIETDYATIEFRGHGLWEPLLDALKKQTTLLKEPEPINEANKP